MGSFIPASNEPSAALARAFGECREGQIPRSLLRIKLDTPSACCGVFDYQENAANFQKTLKDAIAAYGIPNKLYVDNGSPYSNEQLSFICGSVGTVLLHTPVRDGASKG